MLLKTKYFGETEIDEQGIITFNEGLPGFLHLKRFALMNDPDGGFYWLQSVDEWDVAFILIDVNLYADNYEPLVEEEHLIGLGEFTPESFVVLNIANLPGDVKDMTVNLRAPVVINTELKLGRQIVCNNDEYSVRHRIFKEKIENKIN
jgi:flagellar assembly factor FliW